jgi:hypothetical protein
MVRGQEGNGYDTLRTEERPAMPCHLPNPMTNPLQCKRLHLRVEKDREDLPWPEHALLIVYRSSK